MTQKTTPDEAILADCSSSGATKIEGHSKRIRRYSQAKSRADEHKAYVGEKIKDFHGKDRVKLEKTYKALDDCGNFLLFHHYYTVDEYRLVKACTCKKHLLCPLCAIRRAAKQCRAYLQKFEFLRSENPALMASMVTLTVRNGGDLFERFEHLRSGVKRGNARLRHFKNSGYGSSEFTKFQGYVGSYEIKKGKNSGEWHPHCHILVLHDKPIDQAKLSREWEEITGDSFIVDVSPLQNPENPAADFVEIFKYALKFSSMSSEDVFDGWWTLQGKRLMFSAGLFRGVQIPADFLDEPLDPDLPYMELFYRYLPGPGYTLERTRTSEQINLENQSRKRTLTGVQGAEPQEGSSGGVRAGEIRQSSMRGTDAPGEAASATGGRESREVIRKPRADLEPVTHEAMRGDRETRGKYGDEPRRNVRALTGSSSLSILDHGRTFVFVGLTSCTVSPVFPAEHNQPLEGCTEKELFEGEEGAPEGWKGLGESHFFVGQNCFFKTTSKRGRRRKDVGCASESL